MGLVANFRPLPGCGGKVFRSANTDVLASLPFNDVNSDDDGSHDTDRWILEHITMVLDLRSPVERDEAKAVAWTTANRVAGKKFVISNQSFSQTKEDEASIDIVSRSSRRCVVRLPMTYKITHKPYQVWTAKNNDKLQTILGWNQLVAFINEEGLVGLYKILLALHETIFACLKFITIHLEASNSLHPHKVLIHCAQGKDRTGILCMLIESIMDVPDALIVRDYAASHGKTPAIDNILMQAGSDNDHDDDPGNKGTIRKQSMRMADHITSVNLFQDAPASVMEETLRYIRKHYGSVSRYLTFIGFGSAWQRRLRQALTTGTTTASDGMPSPRL